MGTRESELRGLAARCADRSDVLDAWLAKSFTDRLLVVELPEDEPVPIDLAETLEERDLVGFNEVHGVSAEDRASVGSLADRERYRFVDVRTRGDHQSYVVD